MNVEVSLDSFLPPGAYSRTQKPDSSFFYSHLMSAAITESVTFGIASVNFHCLLLVDHGKQVSKSS